MLLFSCFILTSLSCCVATAAIWYCGRVRKLLRGASVRSLAQLSTEVAELTSAFESLSAQQRKLSARVGMREVRERVGREKDDDPQPGDDRVARLNKLREIARGKGFRL
jgi:hypothetical protein